MCQCGDEGHWQHRTDIVQNVITCLINSKRTANNLGQERIERLSKVGVSAFHHRDHGLGQLVFEYAVMSEFKDVSRSTPNHTANMGMCRNFLQTPNGDCVLPKPPLEVRPARVKVLPYDHCAA